MTSAALPSVYDHRELVAQLISLTVGAVLLVSLSHMVIQHQRDKPRDEPIEVTLAAAMPIPSPANAPAQPVEPAKIIPESVPAPMKSRPAESLHPLQKPVADLPKPLPVPHQPAVPVNANAPTVSAEMAPAAAPVAPPSPAVTSTAPSMQVKAPEKSSANAAQTATVEAAYISRVRDYLKSIKRYPTGREASLQRPAGVVEVWFVLARSGELLDMGITTPSGSMLLDAAARSTVRRGEYPPFPPEAWNGKAQHRFTVELDFYPAN